MSQKESNLAAQGSDSNIQRFLESERYLADLLLEDDNSSSNNNINNESNIVQEEYEERKLNRFRFPDIDSVNPEVIQSWKSPYGSYFSPTQSWTRIVDFGRFITPVIRPDMVTRIVNSSLINGSIIHSNNDDTTLSNNIERRRRLLQRERRIIGDGDTELTEESDSYYTANKTKQLPRVATAPVSIDIDQQQGKYILCGSADKSITVLDVSLDDDEFKDRYGINGVSSLLNDNNESSNNGTENNIGSLYQRIDALDSWYTEDRELNENIGNEIDQIQDNYVEGWLQDTSATGRYRIGNNSGQRWDPRVALRIHPRASINAHEGSVTDAKWFPRDTGLFTTSCVDGYLRIWDTNEGKCAFGLDLGEMIYTHSMSYATDGAHGLVACGMIGGEVRLCDLRTGTAVQTLRDEEGILNIHEARERKRNKELSILSTNWSPKESYILASGDGGGHVKLWDVRKPRKHILELGYGTKQDKDKIIRETNEEGTNIVHEGGVIGLKFSLDGRNLCSVGRIDGYATLWDLAIMKHNKIEINDSNSNMARRRLGGGGGRRGIQQPKTTAMSIGATQTHVFIAHGGLLATDWKARAVVRNNSLQDAYGCTLFSTCPDLNSEVATRYLARTDGKMERWGPAGH